MFCPKCGAPHDDSAVFCSRCGTKLDVSLQNGYCDSKSGNQESNHFKYNSDSVSDRQEYLNTRSSMQAKNYIKSANRAKTVSTFIFVAIAILQLGFLGLIYSNQNTREGVSKLIIPALISAILCVCFYFWLTYTVKKLVTEYVVLGFMAVTLLIFAFSYNGNTFATMAPVLMYSLAAVFSVGFNIYRFNSEFLAQCPRMEDNVMMRQKNSLTKVIIFWLVSVAIIVFEIVYASPLSTDLPNDIEPIFLMIESLLFPAVQLTLAWLAYKITKTLRTGKEDNLSQVLHSISYVVVAVGWIEGLAFVSTISHSVWNLT